MAVKLEYAFSYRSGGATGIRRTQDPSGLPEGESAAFKKAFVKKVLDSGYVQKISFVASGAFPKWTSQVELIYAPEPTEEVSLEDWIKEIGEDFVADETTKAVTIFLRSGHPIVFTKNSPTSIFAQYESRIVWLRQDGESDRETRK